MRSNEHDNRLEKIMTYHGSNYTFFECLEVLWIEVPDATALNFIRKVRICLIASSLTISAFRITILCLIQLFFVSCLFVGLCQVRWKSFQHQNSIQKLLNAALFCSGTWWIIYKCVLWKFILIQVDIWKMVDMEYMLICTHTQFTVNIFDILTLSASQDTHSTGSCPDNILTWQP